MKLSASSELVALSRLPLLGLEMADTRLGLRDDELSSNFSSFFLASSSRRLLESSSFRMRKAFIVESIEKKERTIITHTTPFHPTYWLTRPIMGPSMIAPMDPIPLTRLKI